MGGGLFWGPPVGGAGVSRGLHFWGDPRTSSGGCGSCPLCPVLGVSPFLVGMGQGFLGTLGLGVPRPAFFWGDTQNLWHMCLMCPILGFSPLLGMG